MTKTFQVDQKRDSILCIHCGNQTCELNTYVIYPIGSMYGIYANIWGILMVNVTIYSIHGSYGYVHRGWKWIPWIISIYPSHFEFVFPSISRGIHASPSRSVLAERSKVTRHRGTTMPLWEECAEGLCGELLLLDMIFQYIYIYYIYIFIHLYIIIILYSIINQLLQIITVTIVNPTACRTQVPDQVDVLHFLRSLR